MNETLKVLKTRRSIRSYKAQQINKEEIQQILEAGIYAPSGMNRQPWHFTVIQNKEIIDRLSGFIGEEMKASGDQHLIEFASQPGFNVFYHSPTVIIVSGKTELNPVVDCTIAAENLIIAAASLGIGSCWIGLANFIYAPEKREKYLSGLNLPEDYTPIHAIAFGYTDGEAPEPKPRAEGIVNFV